MAYPKALVLIQIWYFKSKCLKIGVSVKAFCRYIKVFLALEVRKSVLELTLIKLAFDKFDFLDLVDFILLDLVKSDFLDLAKFAIIDRFLILSSILLLSAPIVPFNTF